MRGAQLAVNILLFLLVAVLFYFQFDGADFEKDKDLDHDKNIAVVMENKALNIRFVNTDSIWSNYGFVEQLRAELDKKKKQYENELARKVQEFQSEVQDFQQNMMTLTQEEGQQKQQELMLQEQELQQLQEEYNLKLIDEEEKMRELLREKIAGQLQEFKADEVDLILDNSASSSVLLYPDSLDLTASLLKSMNEALKEIQVEE